MINLTRGISAECTLLRIGFSPGKNNNGSLTNLLYLLVS